MDKIRNFKLGWLNLERLLFLLSLLLLLWAALSFLSGPAPEVPSLDSVAYSIPTDGLDKNLPALGEADIPQNPWNGEQEIFALLSAPQLELPPPEPPAADDSVVPPPPYPQPQPGAQTTGEKK